MTDGNVPARVAKTLKDKQSVAIILPTQAPLDAVASALALYFALVKEGKTVSVASPDDIDRSFGLVGQDKIVKNMSSGGNVLVISIPYKEGGIDNVTYNVEGNNLNVLVTPEEGHERLDPNEVSFNYSGGKPDVIVTIYAPNFQSLGAIYSQNKDQFEGNEIINIDRHFTNGDFGTINYVDKKATSVTEMINEVLKALKTDVDKDIASNLFDGLVSATNNFTAHSVDSQTFRMAAFLLDRGAQKKPASGSRMHDSSQSQNKSVSAEPEAEDNSEIEVEEAPRVEETPRGTEENKSPISMPSPLQKQPERPVQKLGEDGDRQQVGTAEAKEGSPKSSKVQLKPQIFQGGSINKG